MFGETLSKVTVGLQIAAICVISYCSPTLEYKRGPLFCFSHGNRQNASYSSQDSSWTSFCNSAVSPKLNSLLPLTGLCSLSDLWVPTMLYVQKDHIYTHTHAKCNIRRCSNICIFFFLTSNRTLVKAINRHPLVSLSEKKKMVSCSWLKWQVIGVEKSFFVLFCFL